MDMVSLEDVEVVESLFLLSGTGTILSADDLKELAQELMPNVGPNQMERAICGLAIRLWDTNFAGLRNEHLREKGMHTITGCKQHH